ncbi:hypothetical protein O6H91_Y554000 [Diphasiastrum complanatum]|nr:hypothetical protein O6H91_Y554000 [Diphasiastrum complanatum]
MYRVNVGGQNGESSQRYWAKIGRGFLTAASSWEQQQEQYHPMSSISSILPLCHPTLLPQASMALLGLWECRRSSTATSISHGCFPWICSLLTTFAFISVRLCTTSVYQRIFNVYINNQTAIEGLVILAKVTAANTPLLPRLCCSYAPGRQQAMAADRADCKLRS